MMYLLLVSLLMLTACDQLPSQQQTAQPAVTGPRYVLSEDQYYGYESSTGEIVMLAYLGHRDGVYQLREKGNAYVTMVYECGDPCEFLKGYSVQMSPAKVIETTRLRASPDMLAMLALQDAAAGYLEPFKAGDDYLWVSSDEGPIRIPIDNAK